MDTFMAIIAVLLGLVGILGSILPVLPGPPLGWVGMLLIYFRGGTDASGDPMSPAVLFIWLGITLAVTPAAAVRKKPWRMCAPKTWERWAI